MPAPIGLPPASAVRARSTVIAVNPDERSTLREGVLVLALGALTFGAVGGYLIGRARKDERRRNNPDDPGRIAWPLLAWPR